MADYTFTRICQFVFNIVNQLFKFIGFTILFNGNEGFPRVVSTARSRQKVGIDHWILGRIYRGWQRHWWLIGYHPWG